MSVSREAGATLTFLNSPSALRQAVDLHTQIISSLSKRIGPETFRSGMVFQPLPAYYSTLGQRNGGNMLGLNRIPSNAILWTTAITVFGDDAALAIAQAELRAMTAKLREVTSQHGTGAEFLYLNYAHASQNPLGSYGPDNVSFMKEVASHYDPQGWWQKRAPGGFKLSRVVV